MSVRFLLVVLFLVFTQFAECKRGKHSYFFERSNLYSNLSSQWFASDVVLSETETKADEKFRELLDLELARTGPKPPASISFFESKSIIDSGSFIDLIKLMPKGANLHTHSLSTGSALRLVKTATYLPNCYIFRGKVAYEEPMSMTLADGSLIGSPMTSKISEGAVIFYQPEANQTIPKDWVLISAEREASRDVEAYDRAIADRFMVHEDMMNIKTKMWTPFEATFGRIQGLVSFEPVYIDYYHQAFLDFAADGVMRLEMRVVFGRSYYYAGEYLTWAKEASFFIEAVNRAKQTYPEFSWGVMDNYLGLICAAPRKLTLDVMRVFVEECNLLKSQHPELILGFDIVGEEDADGALGLIDYLPLLVGDGPGSDLPLYLHAGETSTPLHHNLLDTLPLHPRRIGHGYELFKYLPVASDFIKKYDICLEVCSLSNQALEYAPELRNHPARAYLQLGLPVVIATDDAPIMDYAEHALAYDFYMAITGWELDLASIKKLCLNSIHYAEMKDSRRADLLKWFTSYWAKWIDQLILR